MPTTNQITKKMEVNEDLVAILKKSHTQAMAGQTVAMEEVESFINEKVYELTNSMDTCCVAESLGSS